MAILVDTNILSRWTQPNHSLHALAADEVARLLNAGEDVHFTSQNNSEIWNVATRPIANNGLGFDIAAARKEVELIEQIRTILPDTPAVYEEWKRLVITHSVLGVKVYDVRLVASMNVHRVETLLTFNTDDFLRYTKDAIHPIKLLHPLAVP